MRGLPTRWRIGQAELPSYQAAADFLENKNAAGWRLVGWTCLRAVMIGAPFAMLKVDTKKVIIGSALASTAITLFAVIRIARKADADAKAAAETPAPAPPPP